MSFVLDSSPRIVTVWAEIRVEAERLGRPIERQDAWIAATALTFGLPLMTHNAAHFQHVPGLVIITEPDPKPPRAGTEAG